MKTNNNKTNNNNGSSKKVKPLLIISSIIKPIKNTLENKIFIPMRNKLGNAYYPVILLAIFIIFQILFSTDILNKYLQQIIMITILNIVLTISLGMVNGITGELSIGHAGFMAIGAYVSVIFTTILGEIFVDSIFNTSALLTGNFGAVILAYIVFFLAIFIGGLVAAFGGFLIGFPTLRLKGDYLAIVTLAFCEIIRSLIEITDFLKGSRGVSGIPVFISTNTFIIIVLFAVVSIYFMRNYIFSSSGRSLKAIRDNEIAAEAVGINTRKQKIKVFIISSFVAGVSGGLYAHIFTYINPRNFTFIKSLEYLIYLYVGGAGTVSGAGSGAFVFTIIPEAFRFLGDWRMVIYPLVLILVMLLRTDGIIQNEFRIILPQKLRDLREKRKNNKNETKKK